MNRSEFIQALAENIVRSAQAIIQESKEGRVHLIECEINAIKEKLHLIEHELYRGI